jgi:hypothetical protein
LRTDFNFGGDRTGCVERAHAILTAQWPSLLDAAGSID